MCSSVFRGRRNASNEGGSSLFYLLFLFSLWESLNAPNNSRPTHARTCIRAAESCVPHPSSRFQSPALLRLVLPRRVRMRTRAQRARLVPRGTAPSQYPCRGVCHRPSESRSVLSRQPLLPAALATSAKRNPVVVRRDSKLQLPPRLHLLRAARRPRYVRP